MTFAATPVSARALAPDLARGWMLLLIALANAHVYTFGHALGPRGYPRELTGADQVIVVLQMLFVDGRAYPLFALLFGYGLVQLTRRRADSGASTKDLTALVRRRGRWMLVFGLAHGALLWSGDIIGAYGLIAVVFAALLVRGSTRGLVIMAVVGAAVSALAYSGASLEMPAEDGFLPSMAEERPLVAMMFRVFEWLAVGLGFSFVMAFGAVALGVLAGRLRVLEELDRFAPLLRRLAVLGLGAAVVLGLPLALMAAQVIEVRSVGPALALGAVHALGGYAGGVGYAALFGLIALHLGQRPIGGLNAAVLDSGRRSMSSYLAQSVVFVALLPAWTLGLGRDLGPTQFALVALGTWLLIVVAAHALGRRGFRGPAEVLLRRLTYGRG